MKLTIVVDNYDYEKFVAEAIDSALAQTWPDLEVIVIDDGSKDGSRDVIDKYSDRVKTIYKENGGQGSAFNLAFEHVTGDVIIFVDADDSIDATTGARVMDTFRSDPSAARVQWPLRVVDERGAHNGKVVPVAAMMASGDLRTHVIRYRTHVWSPQSGNAYSTQVLRQLFPVPAEFPMGCDLYLAETSALLGTVHSLPTPGGTYRSHGSNFWNGNDIDPNRLRVGLEWTMHSHRYVKEVCDRMGVECPSDPRAALDVAFLSRRLASVRLDRVGHPIEGDKRLALTARGIWAAVRHPHHTRLHKAKRVGWFLGVGLGNKTVAKRLIRRFYFNR